MDADDIANFVAELEDRVERLRALYDQYFMGIERLEPLILRKEVDRRVWQIRREQIRNTALRFRLQTTIQRYNTYQQYWQRICREIENGTYHRDVTRAAERFGEVALTALGRKRKQMFEKGAARRAERQNQGQLIAESRSPPLPQPVSAEAPAKPLGLESLDDLAPLAEELIQALASPTGPSKAGAPKETVQAHRPDPPVHTAQAEPRPSPDAPTRPQTGELSPTRMREIYGAYVDAKRRCSESTAGITFERLAVNLRNTIERLQAKHPGRHIDFEVVVKNGNAVLKPIVRA